MDIRWMCGILLGASVTVQAACPHSDYAQYRDKAKTPFDRSLLAIEYCSDHKAFEIANGAYMGQAKYNSDLESLNAQYYGARGSAQQRDDRARGEAKLEQLKQERDQCEAEARKIADAIRAAERKLPASKWTDLTCKESASAAAPAPGKLSPSERMKMCNEQADDKRDAERVEFMKSCLHD
jgi:hypothetical protein